MSSRRLSARAFFRDPVGYARACPESVIRFSAPTGGFALIRDPAEIWRLLVTDAGSLTPGKWKRRARRFVGPTLNTLAADEHRRRRLLLQPALDRRRIARFAPAVAMHVERAIADWRDGETIVLRRALDPLSLTAAGEALLSTDLGPQAATLADALTGIMAAVPRLTPSLPGTPGARALGQVHGTVRDLVARRPDAETDDPDLLDLLLASGLPQRTVLGEVTAFLLAAVDEPPSGLAAVWYLLGRNEAVDRRLRVELEGESRRAEASPDELPRAAARYLDAVIAEALRLYPPARHVDRCPVADIHVSGTLLPRGTNILISPLVTHREPALYERPDEFRPERWLEPGGAATPRGAYLPFGAGAHTCIGEPLARLIMETTLATIVPRWRLRVADDAPLPVPRAHPLVVTLERR